MLKRLLCCCLALVLLLGSAAGAHAVDDEEYRVFDQAMYEVIYERGLKVHGLPYISFVDMDGDGFYELVVDENQGSCSEELVHNTHLSSIGSHVYLCRGDCTLYHWNRRTRTMESVRLDNNNMFLAYNPREKTVIASTVRGHIESYSFVTVGSNGSLEVETYEISYYDGKPLNGWINSSEADGVDFQASLRLLGAMGLSFTMYS